MLPEKMLPSVSRNPKHGPYSKLGRQVVLSKHLGREPLSAEDLAGLAITMADFEAAIGKVQPSVRREGFATTPDVTWDDVGALREVRILAILPL